jgi:hypothetical protein
MEFDPAAWSVATFIAKAWTAASSIAAAESWAIGVVLSVTVMMCAFLVVVADRSPRSAPTLAASAVRGTARP